MKVQQYLFEAGTDDIAPHLPSKDEADLVLLFGSRQRLQQNGVADLIRTRFPTACIAGCSTAGEIGGSSVFDDSLVVTSVQFGRTKVRSAVAHLSKGDRGTVAGGNLARELLAHDLRHIFVLSDGLSVNGSDLVSGLTKDLPPHIGVTGGLSADGALFGETVVVANNSCASGMVAAIGFYGNNLQVGYGSVGGWDPFGPERTVTCAEGNILYELDGRSALALYKEYLGVHAEGLPATGLLFPLAVKSHPDATPVVRTILGIDPTKESITFAGDVPVGSIARLMKANFERIIDGACDAATSARGTLGDMSPQLAILISCVGRKLMLKQRIEEEVEAARAVLGDKSCLTGFYSYGELAPFCTNAPCELHNQTMTITAFREDD